VAIKRGRFKEAADFALNIIHKLEKEPWPPKEDDPSAALSDDSSDSAETSELLDLDDTQPAPYPDPQKLPKNPMLLAAEVCYAISLHAQAYSEASHGNTKVAARLGSQADEYLKKLMEQISKSMGPGEWDGLSKTGGIAGSALRRGMGEENTPLVEIVTSLGAQNARDGLHYDKAIAVSKKMNLPKITAMLEEHQALCAYKPSEPPFLDVEHLKAWMTGQWKGSYLYDSGGPRKDPKGLRSLELKATKADRSADSADVEGTATDDQGDWIIKGEADTSGGLSLRFFLKEGSYEQGWEYKGHVNLERRAMGGFWGFRNVEREGSGGSFFYFKC